ncbi:MAG: Na/Pi cotransporter family protein, partial [Gammaproteobacteria bacterium]
SANVQGKRLAGAHLIFNVVTGVIAIVFISQFVWAVDAVSSRVGIGADNYTMKLAVFHTLFNVTGVIVMVPLMARLADFLFKYFPERELDVAEPRYLSDAAFEFPETVLKSVKQEVWHLFDSAFELIAHGLNLHRTQILESPDLKKTIYENREVHEFDLDEMYETKIKALYSAIVDFIARSQTEVPSIFAEEMFRLRNAATEIVESVKHVKHLRKNTTRYILSDNEHIRHEYNRLRYQIAMLLREIYRVREEDSYDHQLAVKDLKQMKKQLRVKHDELNNRIAEVLKDDQITPTMATSLLNDFNYSDGTLKNLYDCAKALLSSHTELVADAAEEINLEDDIAGATT